MNNSPDVLILPGWGDSGSEHWQSLWLNENPHFKRVVQRDWINSNLDEWLDTLSTYVNACSSQVILVGHSLSSILIAHWGRTNGASKVAGALIVAPTDVRTPPVRNQDRRQAVANKNYLGLRSHSTRSLAISQHRGCSAG